MDNLIKVAEGFHFLEGPRWHENKLWFSDMHGYKVHNLDADGNLSTLAEIPEQPSGLGWLPDGSLIIVSMLDRKLMKLKDCLLYTSPSPRDRIASRMPSSA